MEEPNPSDQVTEGTLSEVDVSCVVTLALELEPFLELSVELCYVARDGGVVVLAFERVPRALYVQVLVDHFHFVLERYRYLRGVVA